MAGNEGDRCIITVDPRYFSPTQVASLLGEPSKAKEKLGWTPKISFAELMQEVVREDFKSAQRNDLAKRHGFEAFNHHE